MTILQIECFVEAAAAKSISKASVRLFLSQQSVSRHIKALETELGFPLFERHNKGVRLTPAGEILYPVWEKTLREHHLAIDKAKDTFYCQEKEIKIGLLDCGAFNQHLISSITAFNEQYPQLNISYEFYTAEDLFACLENGTVHMAVSYESELRSNHSFYTLQVCTHPIRTGIYLSRKHPMANRKFSQDMLRGQIVGVLDEEISRDYKERTEEYLKRCGIEKEVTYRYYSARHNLGIALITQKCISIVYETMYENLKDKLAFIPIPELEGVGMIDLIWKEEKYSVKARNLAEVILKNEFASTKTL